MKKRDRFIWIGISTFSLLFMIFLFISPNSFAQEQRPALSNDDQLLLRLKSIIANIESNYVEDVDPEILYKGAIKGILESLEDPYSTYLSEEDLDYLTNTTQGKFGGVGLYIQKQDPSTLSETARDPKDFYVKVLYPIEGTPAYRAGLHANDHITHINGDPVDEMTIDQVTDRLKGTPGTDVNVTILRGKDITLEIAITRAEIEIPTIRYDMIDSDTGYIRIIQWTPYTSAQLKDALREYKRNGYDSLIVDVRGNPGGLLNSVIEVCDLFLSSGVIVSTKSRIHNNNAIYTAYRGSTIVPKEVEIAILIDNGSASASEIFAGAMKDQHRATLIGETTYGKGSVQQLFQGIGDTAYKMTTSLYYTPNDININEIGIDPDIEVIVEEEFSEEDESALEIILDENLIEIFIDSNNRPSESVIRDFMDETLAGMEFKLNERIFKRLIKNEINRRMDSPPVFDLEFDIPLQEALKFVNDRT